MATLTAEELMALPPEYLMEVNPSSQRLRSSAIAFIIVDTIFFAFFILSTRMARTSSPIELYFLMPVAYLGVLGNALVGFLLADIGGLGRHMAYHLVNDPNTITTYLKLQTGVEIIYMASITFPKIAILTLYLRIFVDRLARALAWVMIAILAMFFIAGLILALALCRPYAYKWDKSINGTCGDIMAGYRWISIPSIITDLFILIIPIPTIWKLQMNKFKKIGLFITFLVGGLGFITAIVRCLTFYQSNLFSDPTFLAGQTMTWTIVEPSAYFICACLPRLRLLLKWFLEKTGLGDFVTSTLGTVLNNSKGTQGNKAPTVKHFQASHGRLGSKVSDDTAGFVQLDELQLESLNLNGRN